MTETVNIPKAKLIALWGAYSWLIGLAEGALPDRPLPAFVLRQQAVVEDWLAQPDDDL